MLDGDSFSQTEGYMVPTRALANLIVDLYEVGAIKIDIEKGFELKIHETKPEAPLSPIYLNLRTPQNPKPGPLTPQIIASITMQWRKLIKRKKFFFDGIAGFPNAGTPLATALYDGLQYTGNNYALIELEKTETIEGRRISGIREKKHASVILGVDDLIAHGETKKEAVEVLSRVPYAVKDILVVVDREQGGAAYLAKQGIKLHALCTLRELVDFLFAARKITSQEHTKVIGYLYDARAA